MVTYRNWYTVDWHTVDRPLQDCQAGGLLYAIRRPRPYGGETKVAHVRVESNRLDVFSEMARELPLSDRVAEQLQDAIVARTFEPGDLLPSERELGERFGVSRTVIREALRSLAAKGMLVTQSGRGIRVAAADSRTVADSLHLYLRGIGGIDYSSVHEVRTLLELRIARLAAERATDEQIAELQTVFERMRAASDPEVASIEDLAFHRTIAAMTGNPLFPVLIDSIRGVLLEIRRATLGVPGRSTEVVGYHERILARISARDPEGAEREMTEHLVESYRLWEGASVARPKRASSRSRASAKTGGAGPSTARRP